MAKIVINLQSPKKKYNVVALNIDAIIEDKVSGATFSIAEEKEYLGATCIKLLYTETEFPE